MMTVLGTGGDSPLIQSSLALGLASEEENVPSGVGSVLSTQTSAKCATDELSMMTRSWNAGVDIVSGACKEVSGIITRAWGLIILPFNRLVSTMEGPKAVPNEQLVFNLAVTRNTKLTNIERLSAFNHLITLSNELLLTCSEEEGESINRMLSEGFKAMPTSLIKEMIALLPTLDKRSSLQEISIAFTRVSQSFPSVVIDDLGIQFSKAATNEEKEAIFAKMLKISESDLEPDMTKDIISIKLACIFLSVDPSFGRRFAMINV